MQQSKVGAILVTSSAANQKLLKEEIGRFLSTVMYFLLVGIKSRAIGPLSK